MRLKLLMLGWELPPYNSGGLGVACFQMAKALAKRGDIDIKFVVPYFARHERAEKFMEILAAAHVPPLVDEQGNYVAMGAYSGCCEKCGGSRNCEHMQEYARGFVGATKKYADNVAKLISRKKLRPDVIHAHDWLDMPAGIVAKKITGAPLIVQVHATEFDRAGGHFGNPLIHEIEYAGLIAADRIFAVSQITKDIIVREYGIPAEKIEVVHNSLDPEELARTCWPTKNYLYAKKLREKGWTIVTSGGTRLTVQKGLTFLLRAVALAISRNPKLLFILGGSGEMRDELIALSAELGISDKVIFTDFVRGIRLRELYEIADIFVMSSISEPFGVTALEAAHYDTAEILTKTSGAGEVLANVMRYDFWDTRKLADEIINISLSPALASELRENVRREYLRTSWGDVAEKIAREYDRILAKKRAEENEIREENSRKLVDLQEGSGVGMKNIFVAAEGSYA